MVNTGIAYTAVRYAIGKIQRRKNFRFPANVHAVAVLSNPGKRLIVVKDLHEDGASIQAADRFKAGSMLTLYFSLGKRTFEIKGRVLYVKEGYDRRTPTFYHGIEFEKFSGDAKDAIVVYNFSYAVRKMMQALSIANETPLLKFNNIIKKPPMRLWRTYEK